MANDTPATTPSPNASHPGRFADSLSGGPFLQDDTIVFLIGKAFVIPLDPSSPTFDKPIHNFSYPSIVTVSWMLVTGSRTSLWRRCF